MSKNQNENIEVVAEVEATEVAEEVKESKFKNTMAKGVKWVKKNGLKVALGLGAAVGTGYLIVKAIRKGDEEAALEYLAESDDYDDADYVSDDEPVSSDAE